MNKPSETIKQAIQADEFTRKTLTGVRDHLYALGVDLSVVIPGKAVVFSDDNCRVGYMALSEILGLDPVEDRPNMDGVMVDLGGVSVSAGALQELQKAFSSKDAPAHA